MKKIFFYILICIMCAMCAACTKSSSTLNGADKITENMSDLSTADIEASKEQGTETEFQSEAETEAASETETEAPQETAVKYELSTVESLEDDGKEMSAAEALRSTMKGKHSALELFEEDRMFYLRWYEDDPQAADSIEDLPDEGLAKINMLDYKRSGIGGAITPVEVKWEKFMCVDLDGNGTDEILVKGNRGPTVAVLYYSGDEVYMTSIYSKVCPDIVYESGVWENSPNVTSESYYRLYPAKGAIYRETLAYQSVALDNIDSPFNEYYILGNKVTKEEHDAYVDELIGGLTPLEWHEFTEENIDKYVVD